MDRVATGFNWHSADRRYWLRDESTNNDVAVHFDFNGGNSVLQGGDSGFIVVPFNGVVSGWAIISDDPGSATFDIRRTPIGSPVPGPASSIVNLDYPRMVADTYATGNNLVAWSDTVFSNDALHVVLTEVSGLNHVVLVLFMRRPGIVAAGAQKLDDLLDVSLPVSAGAGDLLRHNGTTFVSVNGASLFSVPGHQHAITDVSGLQVELNNKATQAQLSAIPDASVVQTDLNAHKSNASNPHGVSKAHIGLPNVDNTSDTSKPVSTAQQAALNAKVSTTTYNAQVLNAHANVNAPSPVSGHILVYNGSQWVNQAPATALPSGGTAGQYLRKTSSSVGAAAWTSFVTPQTTYLDSRALTTINVPDNTAGAFLSGTIPGLVTGHVYAFMIDALLDGYGSLGFTANITITAKVGGWNITTPTYQFDQGVDSSKHIHWPLRVAATGTSMPISFEYRVLTGVFDRRYVSMSVIAIPS